MINLITHSYEKKMMCLKSNLKSTSKQGKLDKDCSPYYL